MSIAQLLPMLAAFLPQIVDMLTPDGTVPAGGLNSAASAGRGRPRRDARRPASVAPERNGAPDLGGMLGGLMGGSTGGPGVGGEAPGLDDLLGGLVGGDKEP